MNTLWNDARFAVRMLAKAPGFTAGAAVTLALGIGVNSAVFSVVNALLLRPLPVEAPGELVNVYSTSPGFTGIASHLPTSYPDYRDLRDEGESFAELIAYTFNRVVLDDGEEQRLSSCELVTGDYFAALGVASLLGRTLAPEDDRRGEASPVAVLSHRAWQVRFGGDPGVVGRTLHVNGQAVTVIGVAAAGYDGLLRGLPTELWIPLNMSVPLQALGSTSVGNPTPGLDLFADRARQWIWVLGRLGPGVSAERAAAELGARTSRLAQEYPATNAHRTFVLTRTSETFLVPSVTSAVSVASAAMMGLVGLVLLIACANIANMLLARALFRRKEIATRLALGAGRGAVVRQLLVESLALALLGGGLGLLLAAATNQLLGTVDLTSLFRLELGLALDWRVVAFTFGVATLTALIFGLAPAFAAIGGDLAGALLGESRGMAGGLEKRRLRSALAVAQVAIALLLLICAGLSLRSMENAHRIDPGFEVQGLVVARFAPPASGVSEAQLTEFYRRLEQRVEGLPGVRSVAFASQTPLSVFEFSLAAVAAEGRDAAPPEDWPKADTAAVGPGYFETLRLPLLRGRAFTEHDDADSPRVAVVNETLAASLWPGEPGVGRRLRVDGLDGAVEVVGVARDAKYRTLGEGPRPFLYVALAQNPPGGETLVARVEGPPQAAVAAVRQLSRDLERKMAIIDSGTMEQAIGPSLLLPRAGAALFGAFGLIGLALAATGIYGVLAYVAGRRTHEIGIRMAMGAARGDILRLIVRDGVVVTVIGVALGLGGAAALTRWLSAILYGISATDVLTFTAVPLFLGLVAFFASYLPALRASRVDPLVALRYE